MLYAIGAITLYAIANVIFERKLAKISPLASTTFLYVGLLLFSAPLLLMRDQLKLALTMPQTNQCWLLVVCGVLFFLADLSYFYAYKLGGTLEQVALASLLYPVIATIIKTVSGGTWPSRSDAASWVIAAVAVVVAVKQPWR